MPQHDVVMAGFGGQGLMAIGKLLAKAAMYEGRHVTWLPSYGPEMRGGTANCVVVVDDAPIGSPFVQHAQAALVMNRPSFDKFAELIAPGGLLVINASLVEVLPVRPDVQVLRIAANELATTAGSAKAANMAMLGAYLGCCPVVRADTVRGCIGAAFAGKRPAAGEASLRAFELGMQAAADASEPRSPSLPRAPGP